MKDINKYEFVPLDLFICCAVLPFESFHPIQIYVLYYIKKGVREKKSKKRKQMAALYNGMLIANFTIIVYRKDIYLQPYVLLAASRSNSSSNISTCIRVEVYFLAV